MRRPRPWCSGHDCRRPTRRRAPACHGCIRAERCLPELPVRQRSVTSASAAESPRACGHQLTRVLLTPPGKILLNCSYDTGTTETTAVAVEVQDPEHHFRATTLAELGCRPIGNRPTWAFGPGEGKTPDAAIRALLDEAELCQARRAAPPSAHRLRRRGSGRVSPRPRWPTVGHRHAVISMIETRVQRRHGPAARALTHSRFG